METEYKFGNPALVEAFKRGDFKANFIEDLGIRFVEAEPGKCVLDLDIKERHWQQNSYVHAGVISTLADHAAGGAAATLVKAGEIVLTIEYKINFLRPARGDSLRCEAGVLSFGKTNIISESCVYATRKKNTKLVAKAMVTLGVVKTART